MSELFRKQFAFFKTASLISWCWAVASLLKNRNCNAIDGENRRILTLRIIRKLGKNITWHFSYGDFRFIFPLESEYISHIFLYGSYEIDVTLFLTRFLQPGMKMIDIGANVGLFSILSSRLVGTQGLVWSFEPDPRACELLQKNVRLNTAGNISIFPLALSDQNLEKNLFSTTVTGYSSLIPPIGPNSFNAEVINVQCLTLDSLTKTKGVDCIDLMKIDAEGSEFSILLGAKNTLERSPNLTIICEFGDACQRSAGRSTGELYNLLESLGFKIFHYNVDTNELEFEPPGKTYDYVNLIACRDPQFVNGQLARNSSVGVKKWRWF